MIHNRGFQASAGFVLRLFSSGMRCSGASQKHRDLTIYISVTKIISYKVNTCTTGIQKMIWTGTAVSPNIKLRYRRIVWTQYIIPPTDGPSHSCLQKPAMSLPSLMVVIQWQGSKSVGVKQLQNGRAEMAQDVADLFDTVIHQLCWRQLYMV